LPNRHHQPKTTNNLADSATIPPASIAQSRSPAAKLPEETTILLRAGIAASLSLVAYAAQAQTPVASVRYSCAEGKSLSAEYFDGPTRTAPDGRPIPGGRVVLTLADGKKLDLPQTLSGSGIRYANQGETFVFWSKGDTAFVEEGQSQTVTYKDCVGRKR
jgi:membrane-bound inhibitor of C-type lysozyme